MANIDIYVGGCQKLNKCKSQRFERLARELAPGIFITRKKIDQQSWGQTLQFYYQQIQNHNSKEAGGSSRFTAI